VLLAEWVGGEVVGQENGRKRGGIEWGYEVLVRVVFQKVAKGAHRSRTFFSPLTCARVSWRGSTENSASKNQILYCETGAQRLAKSQSEYSSGERK